MNSKIKGLWVPFPTPPSFPNSKLEVKCYAENNEALSGRISSRPVWRAVVMMTTRFGLHDANSTVSNKGLLGLFPQLF